MLLRRIEDRHLPPLQRIEFVGVDLAHHMDERIAGGDEQPGLAISREIHVARPERLAERATDRLFAHVLHIERRLALPLRHEHSHVEGPQGHHVTQSLEQFLVAQETGPRAHSFTVAVENADDRIGEITHRFGVGVHLWSRDLSGLRDHNV